MPRTTYVIEFRFPEGKVYAGPYKDSLGFAPTLKTASFFSDAESAKRMLENGYGSAMAEWGYVVPVSAGA